MMLMNFLPIILLIITCFGGKIQKRKCINDNYLSTETGKAYRGLFSIVVIFHHLALSTQGGLLFRGFFVVGYLAVAVFFFYSGYGLQKSYITKKDDYRKSFIKNRIPTILIPYIIVTFLYWGLSYLLGIDYSVNDVLGGLVNGYPIVPNSWYIIAIILWYFAFWDLMFIFRNRYFAMLLGGCLFYVVYIYICRKLGFGSWWYNSVHLVIVGMAWAIYESEITHFIKTHFIITPLVWVTFVVLFIAKQKFISYIPIRGIGFIFEITTAFFFVASVLLFSTKVTIGNKILQFLGEISLETYLIHGLFIQFFRSNIIYVSNEFIWSSLVLVFSVVWAWILHIIFKKILSQYKKFVCS